ncbi:hypothetical protein GS682_33020 [Nostoc sp. B(2019)]|nr:hypothetical protein [Nostoc sp. B(2019)]
MKKLGLGSKKIGKDSSGDRQRVYQIVGNYDDRVRVFVTWLMLDEDCSQPSLSLLQHRNWASRSMICVKWSNS